MTPPAPHKSHVPRESSIWHGQTYCLLCVKVIVLGEFLTVFGRDACPVKVKRSTPE